MNNTAAMPEFITYVIDKTHPEFIRAVAENKVIQIVINIVVTPQEAKKTKKTKKTNNEDQNQEYFDSFVREKIREKEGATISKTDLLEYFKCWYKLNYGGRIPKGKYITDLMNNRFGIFDKGWHNIELFMEEEDDDIDI